MLKSYYSVLFIFLSIITFFSIVFANAVIIDFKGEERTNLVVLKWTTLNEVDCKEFVIERSMDKLTFEKRGTVKATNTSERKEYQFEDKSVFRTTANTFHYRLKIINIDGSEVIYSKLVTVTPATTIGRHTWGSIKAMFR